MSKFSDHDRQELLKSPYVSSVTDSQITFTPEFKKEVVERNLRGISPADAFKELGINIALFLTDFPKKSASRWKKIYEEEGFEGLKEKRGKSATGRPKRSFDPNNVKDLQRRIMELEAENFIIKKLNALAANSRKKKGSK